jgi:uncharacterized protein YecE (DUF72 family)
MQQAIPFYSGTSGLVLPVPNKLFYPEGFKDKSRLTYYGSLFNSIEINSSFYKVPMNSTVARWASGVPEDFKFTFKLFREITHQNGLHFDNLKLSSFMETINRVESKKGCLLIQLPPGINISYKNQLIKMLGAIKKMNAAGGWKLVIEFRDHSWYSKNFRDLMDKLGITIVIHDMPKSATPLVESSLGIVYMRLHGPAGDYRGSYSPDALKYYKQNICLYLKQEKTVFLYFNNTIGDAVKNLVDINRMVEDEFKS